MINTIKVIDKYYHSNPIARKLLLKHSESVAKFALKVARNCAEYNWNYNFIWNAAMLHDIGIIATFAPKLDCWGRHQYIEHGYIGSKILQKEGFFKYAKIAERHTGTGISKKEIIEYKLPIPKRDMMPISKYEKLICFADNFFSKTEKNVEKPKEINKIIKGLERFGKNKVILFFKYGSEFNFF